MLGRTSGSFWDVDLHFVVVVILHLLMFFIHIFFLTSSLTLPWTIARFLDPFCTFSPAHNKVIRNTFIFSTIPLSSYRERYGFERRFFTHRPFLPYAPSRHFWHILDILAQAAFIKVSLGVASYFLESCRASYWSSKHRPGPSVCLIHSNSQSFIHLSFVFMHINIAEVLLMVKTLIRSAAMKI